MLPKASRGRLDYPSLGLTELAAAREPGATTWPAGFAHLDRDITVGSGRAAFDALAEGIMGWQVQRLAGLSVKAPPRAVVGARVVSGFGVGSLRLPVPCEVVWAMEPAAVEGPGGETIRAGFGYGTLPGHPALGEEAFVAELAPGGAVHFRLLAFSRPAGLIYTLGAPVTRLAQSGVTRSYQQAARQLAGGF
ncbi:uncharacterized protein (UPF0548 family) [Arthrobacter stackebrandtii]|uniref:Uncharacterized protein (UPF0548 family) n=1 Tax=Arthrobacter stackebrandtii TaxID=272161 RepID=A0ABS4YW47_9MICC|nr:DUF1990 domain-containing protein [Arthrobacter stackebrandtii]MBP2412986.1 uncharacterized protein (UPF0548 family) [Arthrobacter stackebrandtii]PYH01228.1 DUF1990 domain-containing protein [Arthrobacter stackebrandtii]